MLRGANEDCKEVVYYAEVVESCPTSKFEWEIAARRKKCREVAAEAERKNCTINKKQPEYHCLINALRNKLLEVCVAEKYIFGNFLTVFIFNFKEGLGGQQLTHKMSLKVYSSIICHKLIIPI